MTVVAPSLCLSCVHYSPDDPSHCPAFAPRPIPVNIAVGLYDHRRPYPGDHGIQYELAPGREVLLEAYEDIVEMTDDDERSNDTGVPVLKGQWNPALHPRGNPANAGEFGSGGGGNATATDSGASDGPASHSIALPTGQQAPGLIAPHLSEPVVNPSGRGGRKENWDATKFSTFPKAFQTKVLAHLKAGSPNKLTPDDIYANLSHVYDHALTSHWEPGPDGADETGSWKAGRDETAFAGMEWYANAQGDSREVAKIASIPVSHGVGMVAALSPQTDWDSNIAMAKFMATKLKADEIPDIPEEERTYRARQSQAAKGETKGITIPPGKKLSEMTPGQAAWAMYAMASVEGLKNGLTTQKGAEKKAQLSMGTNNVAKAIRIYRGESPDAILSGHKVRSFYNNISDPENAAGNDDVTVDTHMVAAGTAYRVTASGRTIKKMFEGTGANTALNVKGSYAVFADAVRKVAKAHNITPNQAQAVIWTHWQTVKGGVHHGYREDFPEIENDVPPKSAKVKAKERETKERAARNKAAKEVTND